jgi:hypothetical protein
MIDTFSSVSTLLNGDEYVGNCFRDNQRNKSFFSVFKTVLLKGTIFATILAIDIIYKQVADNQTSSPSKLHNQLMFMPKLDKALCTQGCY